MNNLTLPPPQVDALLPKPVLPPAEIHYLTESELAARWRLSPKTLQRWRSTGSPGPRFAKFTKKVLYPLEGQGCVLDMEQRVLGRSTPEQALTKFSDRDGLGYGND